MRIAFEETEAFKILARRAAEADAKLAHRGSARGAAPVLALGSKQPRPCPAS
jgi:hypothetical protein